jgi:hypothetical protein
VQACRQNNDEHDGVDAQHGLQGVALPVAQLLKGGGLVFAAIDHGISLQPYSRGRAPSHPQRTTICPEKRTVRFRPPTLRAKNFRLAHAVHRPPRIVPPAESSRRAPCSFRRTRRSFLGLRHYIPSARNIPSGTLLRRFYRPALCATGFGRSAPAAGKFQFPRYRPLTNRGSRPDRVTRTAESAARKQPFLVSLDPISRGRLTGSNGKY